MAKTDFQDQTANQDHKDHKESQAIEVWAEIDKLMNSIIEL